MKMLKTIILCLLCQSLFNMQAAQAAQWDSSSFLQNMKGRISGFSEYAKDKYGDIKDGINDLIAPNKESNESSSSGDKNFKKIWQEFSSISNQAVELAASKNPTERTAFEFVTFQEPKYVRLIREAQQILSNSEANEQFEYVEELRNKNAELNSEITQLKRARITAPEKSLNPIVDTRKKIEAKIDDLTAEIRANDDEIAKLKQEIIELVNKHGIALSMEELNYFLVSAEGDDLIKLITIAENMKMIQKIIENELKDDKSNIELARIYAGMYLVSLDAYASAHEATIDNLYKYREKLDDIKEEAVDNREEAKALRSSAASEDKPNVESNIRINDRVIEVAGMYDNLLKRRADNLRESKANVDKKVRVARNTYKTIVNGASLINLVNEGSNDYMLIVNFEMPELKNLYDEAFMSVFSDIAGKIKMEK